jgi:hypothetical protein
MRVDVIALSQGSQGLLDMTVQWAVLFAAWLAGASTSSTGALQLRGAELRARAAPPAAREPRAEAAALPLDRRV